jgi:cell division protein FtsL
MTSVRSLPKLQQSISGKLIRMNVIVATIALICACSSFLVYDAYSFRHNLIRSLAAESQIIGLNSVSALTFDDTDSARTTLGALRSSPEVVSALIVKASGEPFAAYLRDNGSPEIIPPSFPQDQLTGNWMRGDDLLVGNRIILGGKTVGTVYLEAETVEISRRVRRYVLISAGVLVLCLLIALVLTSSTRRVIADPISGLAQTAQAVSRDQDFFRFVHKYRLRTMK